MATVTVRFFAAAAEAAGVQSAQFEATGAAGLRAALAESYGGTFAGVLERCSLLIDGVHEDAVARLSEGAIVDVMPPFAGG